VAIRDEVGSCKIRKGLDDEPLFLIEIPATLVRSCVQNVPGNIGKASPAVYTQSVLDIDQGQSGVATSPTLLGPV